MQKQYDYIITGAGCAGLSLLMRILQEPSLNKKSILVIDEQPKNKNDRTWCFWEQEKGLFDEIVHHRWQELKFDSAYYSSVFSIAPYSYKMIQGLDFYNHVINFAKQFPNVAFRYEKVIGVTTENDFAVVQLTNEKIYSSYIFNSILFEQPVLHKNTYYLLQHFKGWVIETKEPCFNINTATFMDFTVRQKHSTTFMYVLPISETKALVEYTLFTKELLEQDEYTIALKKYIAEKITTQDYTVVHEEFGIIPMTNYLFPRHNNNVIYIGIAGGQAKGSSGYAFNFIQKRTAKIVESLLQNNHPFVSRSFSDKKFHLYDSVLLNVLYNKKIEGAAVFSAIFQKNKPQTVLQFLDNQSNFLQDLKIMSSVPTSIFLPAAFREMLS